MQAGVLDLVNKVLDNWGPALRAALLLGILIVGAVAIVKLSPWASVFALGTGGWLAARRKRGRS